jgi:hypothetical protein
MEQSTQFDANSAFVQVKHEIIGLRDFDGEDNQDDVIYIANKLNTVLRAVLDNYQAWSDAAIREFVLSQNDPLRNLDFMSDELNNMVRKIQHDIITTVKLAIHGDGNPHLLA